MSMRKGKPTGTHVVIDHDSGSIAKATTHEPTAADSGVWAAMSFDDSWAIAVQNVAREMGITPEEVIRRLEEARRRELGQ